MSSKEEFKIPQYYKFIGDFATSVRKKLNSLENQLNSFQNQLNSLEKRFDEQQHTISHLMKRIEENKASTNDTVDAEKLMATIEETQYEHTIHENKEEEDLLSIGSETLLNENMNHNNHKNKNHNMPLLEPGTEAQERNQEKSQKENLGPTALQLFGLQTIPTEIVEEPENDNNIDLDVLFSSFTSTANLARDSMNQQDYETALEFFRDALDEMNKYVSNINDLSPDKKQTVAVAYCNKSICFGRLGKWDDAMINIQKCRSINANWYKTYSTMGTIYRQQGNIDEAIKAYKQAMDLSTNEVEIQNKLQRRYKSLLELKQNMNINRNKRRMTDSLSWEESPVKRRKLSMKERREQLQNKLQNKTVSELSYMLEKNAQKKSGRKEELIERVCDGVLNGAIPKCPECNSKFLKYNANTGYYSCGGSFNAVTKRKIACDFYSKDVVRKPWIK